jgi:hypothetical protein
MSSQGYAFLISERPLLYKFLDAGSDESLRTLGEPASKSVEARSRGKLGRRLGSERYGV